MEKLTKDFVHWLMDNCELIADKETGENVLWRYESEDYTVERLFEIFSEELKQETVEEAFEKWADQQFEKGIGYDKIDVLRFGAKWQAERMYSEEEVHNILDSNDSQDWSSENNLDYWEWFKQFEKK